MTPIVRRKKSCPLIRKQTKPSVNNVTLCGRSIVVQHCVVKIISRDDFEQLPREGCFGFSDAAARFRNRDRAAPLTRIVCSSRLRRTRRLPGARRLIFACEQRTLSVRMSHPSFSATSSALRPPRSIMSAIVASTAFPSHSTRPIEADVGNAFMEMMVPE